MSDEGFNTPEGAKKAVEALIVDIDCFHKQVQDLRAEVHRRLSGISLGHLLTCKAVPTHARLQKLLQEFKADVEFLSETVIHNHLETVRKSVIPQLMESQDISSLNVKGLGRVELRPDLFVSIVKGQTIKGPELDGMGNPIEGTETEVDAQEWLCRNGLGDLVTETVNASSLKAAIKKKIEKGVEVPAALFKMTPTTQSVVVKK